MNPETGRNHEYGGKRTKEILDSFLSSFDFGSRLENDPVRFPHRFRARADREAVSFIASCFAYGKVSLFFRVIEAVLERLGPKPAKALARFDAAAEEKRFSGVEYRFNRTRDIVVFLEAVGRAIRERESLCAILVEGYSAGDETVMPAASKFVKTILKYAEDVSQERFSERASAGTRQLMPDPEGGSTCKRLCMWLRWMVRGPDAIDLGLAKQIPASKLVIPLDTHVSRIAKLLGFTRRKDQSLKTAVEITGALKKFDPDDPVKYDFAIAHVGISGFCRRGAEGENCDGCPLFPICGFR